MTQTTEKQTAVPREKRYPTPIGFVPKDNGLTDTQVAELLAAAGRHKNDPEYIERGREQVAEYRRQIQEEYEHELAEEDSK